MNETSMLVDKEHVRMACLRQLEMLQEQSNKNVLTTRENYRLGHYSVLPRFLRRFFYPKIQEWAEKQWRATLPVVVINDDGHPVYQYGSYVEPYHSICELYTMATVKSEEKYMFISRNDFSYISVAWADIFEKTVTKE